jgi:uncharacterized damage-inducible protein DinB
VPRIPEELASEFDRFVQGPARLRAALSGLDSPAFNRRPPGDEWSIRDVVMHLADAELVRAVAFRLVIAHDEARIPRWDEERFKRRLHYLFRDPELALTQLQTVRFGNAELLQQLDAAGWQRSGTRESDGSVATLADLVRRAVEHDARHVAQIEATRLALTAAAPGR